MEDQNQVTWSRGHGRRFSHHTRVFFWSMFLCLFVTGIGLCVYSVVRQRAFERLIQQEQTLVQEVTELDTLNNQKKILETDTQRLDMRLSKIQKVTCTSKNNPYPYLHAIEKIIPDNAVLTLFSFERKKIHLEGIAHRIQAVTTFMRTLAKSKVVKLPQLTTLERNKKDGTVRFVIKATKT